MFLRAKWRVDIEFSTPVRVLYYLQKIKKIKIFMENTANEKEKRESFMQGWGFILLVIIIVIGGLVGLKAIID